MKKVFILLFILGLISLQAQIGGIKVGRTYNANTGLVKSEDNTKKSKKDGSVGFHIGIHQMYEFNPESKSTAFIEPEIWYVNYKNRYKLIGGDSFDIKYSRLDVPVSIGYNFRKVFNIKTGAVLSYYFEDTFSLKEVSDIKQNNFVFALQLGAGLIYRDFKFSLRYDFPIGERETKFTHNNDKRFKVEGTPNLVHLSLIYSWPWGNDNDE